MAICRAYDNPDLFITFTSNPKWPEIAKIVTDYMLHGPCGKKSRYAACTTDGKCLKQFPKAFLPKTFLDEEGYPHYRRRDNKVTVKKGKFTYDNKHVVPHNRYMLLKYNAHINVDWCNRSKAIKYLFKYLNKGPDRATIVIEENVKMGLHWQLKPSWRGVQGFEELMTVNNRICPTFKEACFTYGLLNDNREWTKAISEASLPLKLLEENWQTLSEDILHKKRKLFNYPKLQLKDVQICNYCLLEIQEFLHRYGRSLEDFKALPRPDLSLLTNMDNRLIREALDF
ncbi:ATP-dependent DNA helicase PIF1-like protein [Tanacetum coccineum]